MGNFTLEKTWKRYTRSGGSTAATTFGVTSKDFFYSAVAGDVGDVGTTVDDTARASVILG